MGGADEDDVDRAAANLGIDPSRNEAAAVDDLEL
jgi:DNA-directed RNA polymerase subunit beta